MVKNTDLTVGDLHKNTKTFKHGKLRKVTVFFHFDALSLKFIKTLLAKMDKPYII